MLLVKSLWAVIAYPLGGPSSWPSGLASEEAGWRGRQRWERASEAASEQASQPRVTREPGSSGGRNFQESKDS